MLPLLEAGAARNWARDNNVIAQEILIISLAVAIKAEQFELSTVVQFDTEVYVNGTLVVGSIMTNEDLVGASYYATWADQIDDAKKREQMDTVIKYFQRYGYSITAISTTGTSIAWSISW